VRSRTHQPVSDRFWHPVPLRTKSQREYLAFFAIGGRSPSCDPTSAMTKLRADLAPLEMGHPHAPGRRPRIHPIGPAPRRPPGPQASDRGGSPVCQPCTPQFGPAVSLIDLTAGKRANRNEQCWVAAWFDGHHRDDGSAGQEGDFLRRFCGASWRAFGRNLFYRVSLVFTPPVDSRISALTRSSRWPMT